MTTKTPEYEGKAPHRPDTIKKSEPTREDMTLHTPEPVYHAGDPNRPPVAGDELASAKADPPDPKVFDERGRPRSPLDVLRECLRINPNESPENLMAALDAAGYVLNKSKDKDRYTVAEAEAARAAAAKESAAADQKVYDDASRNWERTNPKRR